jgi:hypothetical protein
MMNIMAQSHDQNQYRTFFGTLQTIYREEGWRGFYKGKKSDMQVIVPPSYLYPSSTASISPYMVM